MNYRHVYMCIIAHAKQEQFEGKRPSNKSQKKNFENYFEFHHIFPKSLFPKYKNLKQNLVALTAREHFFVHQLLTKIYPGSEMAFALHAFISRPNADYKITSREYERIKKQHSIEMSKQMKGNTYGFKKGNIPHTALKKLRGEEIIPWNKGLHGYKVKPASEERKQKISKANKGKKHFVSEETRKKISESHKGFIVKEETKQKISKANKGKPTWNKGKKLSEEQKKNMKINARNKAKNCGYKILLVNTNEIFDCLQDVIEKYPTFSKSHILGCLNGKRHVHGDIDGVKCEWRKLI